MSKSIRISLVVSLAFCGCSLIPKYTRPAPPVAPEFPGATPASAGYQASDVEWRDFFGDERLKKLIELALVNNRDMRVAVLNVEESRAEYRVTRSASYPTVNVSGSYTRSALSSTGFPQAGSGSGTSSTFISNEWSASVGTSSYEVDLWGRVRSLNRQALEQYFATDEGRRNEQISLVSQIATEYFTEREAQELLDLSRRTLETVQQSYNLNKAMFDAGASNELDLREAESQVETAQINVTTYQREIAQAENDLALLVGEPLPKDLPAASPFNDPNLFKAIRPGLPSDLLERRPDILEAEHTLKAANANIGAARAAFFPTIVLTGSVGSTSGQLTNLFSPGTGVWSFSPQFTMPIFKGGELRANLDAARVTERIDVANYEKAIQTAFREVADALVAAESYSRQIEQDTSLVGSEQRRYDLATLRYEHGADTYLNVLSAQQDLFSAQQQLIQAQYNKLSSQISLYQALGGGWK